MPALSTIDCPDVREAFSRIMLSTFLVLIHLRDCPTPQAAQKLPELRLRGMWAEWSGFSAATLRPFGVRKLFMDAVYSRARPGPVQQSAGARERWGIGSGNGNGIFGHVDARRLLAPSAIGHRPSHGRPGRRLAWTKGDGIASRTGSKEGTDIGPGHTGRPVLMTFPHRLRGAPNAEETGLAKARSSGMRRSDDRAEPNPTLFAAHRSSCMQRI